jgi:hypothetical protein
VTRTKFKGATVKNVVTKGDRRRGLWMENGRGLLFERASIRNRSLLILRSNAGLGKASDYGMSVNGCGVMIVGGRRLETG